MKRSPLILVVILLAVAGCAITEQQQYGYQSAELILRADELRDRVSPAEYAPVQAARGAYNAAVSRGDAVAMRRALDELHAAEMELDKRRGGLE